MSIDTVSPSADSNVEEQVSTRVRWSRYGYLLLAGIFVVCVVVQVFIAGMAVFVDPANWSLHMTFVHVFEFLLIPILVLAFLGQLPRDLKWLPVVFWTLIGLQYATAEGFSASLVAAIHPVNALVIFWLSVFMTRRTWHTVAGTR